MEEWLLYCWEECVTLTGSSRLQVAWGICMDTVAKGASKLRRQSLESDAVYSGKGSQSTRIYNFSGKKKEEKEATLGQHWFIGNNAIEETMKKELKLEVHTCCIKYQCNHFAADNMHGN